MSNTNMVSLAINEDMVKPILQKQVEAAILANIGNPEELIRKTVAFALSQKVDKRGEVSKYNHDNKFDFLELLVSQAIRDEAKRVLENWVKENMAPIRAAVLKELQTPSRQRSVATAFADAVEQSLATAWRFNCDVIFKAREDN